MTVSLQNEEWERARTARLARARKGTLHTVNTTTQNYLLSALPISKHDAAICPKSEANRNAQRTFKNIVDALRHGLFWCDPPKERRPELCCHHLVSEAVWINARRPSGIRCKKLALMTAAKTGIDGDD
jgi:hypothetical protein